MLLEMNVSLRLGNFDLMTDLSVQDQNIGLFGCSGAGKSTILGLLAGTLIPQSGRIVLESELKLPVVYASHTLEDIAEFSETILVITDGRIITIGQIDDLLWDVGLRHKLGLHQFENKIQAYICTHDVTMGCTLAKTYGIELVLPLRSDLSPGMRIDIAISSNDIALSRNYLQGISIQNQIKGQICALIANKNGVLVQVDCGTVLLAGITLKACRDMNLQEGDTVYCLVKTHSFSYRINSALEPFQEFSTFKNH